MSTDKKISELELVASRQSGDMIPLVRAGVNKRIDAANFAQGPTGAPGPDGTGEQLITAYDDLADAVSTLGSTPSTLVIDTVQALAADITTPATLTLRFVNQGGLQVASGKKAFINGPIEAPPVNIFTGAGAVIPSPVTNPTVFAAWWIEKSVTVPGPALAPTLIDGGAITGGATFTNAVTYLVAYSYVAWNGETGLSPTTSFTAKNSQAIGVLPHASLANNTKYAVGAHFYISPDAGGNWYRADGGFTRPALISMGDDTAGWGGALLNYANGTSGAAPEAGGTTTTTKSGLTVPVPAVAPTVVNLGAIAAGTYYGAFAYLCDDGTETPLSPVSSGLVLGAAGHFIRLQRNEEPPSGAVAVRLYLGTSATPANLHLQTTVPLHYVTPDIHDYSTGGAAPSSGTAVSYVSNLQQAYDQIMESAKAARIMAGPAPTSLKCPFILRLKNSAGNQVPGIAIEGVGGHQSIYNSTAAGRLTYAGTQSTAVVGVCYSTTDLQWAGLDLRDPNSKLSVGLGSCDFFGGGGFESRWLMSTFEAKKAGSIGYQIPVQASGSGGHSSSEQHFSHCNFSGDAWGADVHGAQTIDIHFAGCAFLSNGNSSSANSGQLRNATRGVTISGWEGTGAAAVGYVLFITRDIGHPQAGGYRTTMRDAFIDAVVASAVFSIHVSAVALNNDTIAISDSLLQSSVADRYAFYSGTSASLVVSNVKGGGHGWVNWINTTPDEPNDRATIEQVGPDSFFEIGSTYSFKVSHNTTGSFTDNFAKVAVNLLSPLPGADLTISSNTIAPTNLMHQVGAGLIKTITVPPGFTSGSIEFIPTAAFTYDATDNVLGTGTAVVGRTMRATLNPKTGKFSMSY